MGDMRNMGMMGVAVLAGSMMLVGCSSVKKDAGGAAAQPQAQVMPSPAEGSAPVAMVAKASAFKMSGDYADRVAVTLGADGALVYYPAPTDLTDASRPVEIGDGWWLNTQGLGPGSVFTRWTFAEYRALKRTPTQAEIKEAILPGARVTDFRQLPLTAAEAARVAPTSLLQYLKN